MEDTFCIHKYEPFYLTTYKPISEDAGVFALFATILTAGIALIPLLIFYFFGPYRVQTYKGHHCKHCGIKQAP